jgi:hypothetical protein
MNYVVGLALVPVLLVYLEPAAAQDRQVNKPVTAVMIDAPASEARLGMPFQLKLSLTNISDHAIMLGDVTYPVDGPVYRKVLLRAMDIQVRDASGHLVAETEYGKTIHGRSLQPPPPPPPQPANSPPRPGPVAPKGFGTYLAPGKSVSEESDLSKVFDLSRPGTYTVQAIGRGHDFTTEKNVASNTVTFTITP